MVRTVKEELIIVVANFSGHQSQPPEEFVKWAAGLLGLGLGTAFVLSMSGDSSSGGWEFL